MSTTPTPIRGELVRAGWTPVNRKRLPKSGIIIAGSWRVVGGEKQWTMSTPCDCGWGGWFDADRTHFLQLPKPPKKP